MNPVSDYNRASTACAWTNYKLCTTSGPALPRRSASAACVWCGQAHLDKRQAFGDGPAACTVLKASMTTPCRSARLGMNRWQPMHTLSIGALSVTHLTAKWLQHLALPICMHFYLRIQRPCAGGGPTERGRILALSPNLCTSWTDARGIYAHSHSGRRNFTWWQ